MSAPRGRRWILVLAALAGIVAATSLVVSAHDKEIPHKKLFDYRWQYQVEGGDYDAWMTLQVNPASYACDNTENQCRNKWEGPFNDAIADWNSQPTTVRYAVQPDSDENHDVTVAILDIVLDDPTLLGVDITTDANGDFCDPDATCAVRHELDLIGDDGHTGPYGTSGVRRATIAHELGHGISLAHESVNEEESVLYPCGQDNRGAIPPSVMSYNCIDPPATGGAGEYDVQPFDVCGVNHAYYDPGIEYAECDIGPLPTIEIRYGDANCNGGINSVDAAVTLQLIAGLVRMLDCPINADASGDGGINAIDASLILQYSAGYLDELPP